MLRKTGDMEGKGKDFLDNWKIERVKEGFEHHERGPNLKDYITY